MPSKGQPLSGRSQNAATTTKTGLRKITDAIKAPINSLKETRPHISYYEMREVLQAARRVPLGGETTAERDCTPSGKPK